MKKLFIGFLLLGGFSLTACDLQPKIASFPDSVGEFISTRYPALLADPETQPEIYNSAATDYGVYASPNLYGSVQSEDYIEYASVNDYIVPPQEENLGQTQVYGEIPKEEPRTEIAISEPPQKQEEPEDYLVVPMYGGQKTKITQIKVQPGDTLYSLSKKYSTSVEEIAKLNNMNVPYPPLSVGQTLNVPQTEEITVNSKTWYAPDASVKTTVTTKTDVKTVTKVQLQEITVQLGDTLYSLSRKYSVPVNDLAVMNGLSAPFTLSVGQKLKVPNLSSAPVKVISPVVNTSAASTKESKQVSTAVKTMANQYTTPPQQQKTVKVEVEQKPVVKQKISSDPNKKLPAITARSSSKFSWPVRGKILSHYGSKSGGLFNDGINIGAAKGTAVKAAENGVVAYAGNEVKGMGNLIIVQHSGGWMTVYAHMDNMIVRRGAKVSVGQKIGTVGQTGKVDRPQLHFEIRKGTKAYNPSSYLK